MKIYEWLDDCIKARENNVPYRELAQRYNTTAGTISAALWRYRNGYTDYGERWKSFSEQRLFKILKYRKEAVEKVISAGVVTKDRHLKLLEAWGRGCTNEECAIEAGYSRAWVHTLLKSYGLDTAQKFRSATLRRVREQQSQEEEKK